MPNDEDEVGYGKPPRANRFQKGRSGNPSGRPKKLTSLLSTYEKLSRELILVTEGGKSKRIPRREALLRRVFQLGLSGNARVFSELMKLEARFELIDKASGDPMESEELSEQLINDFLAGVDRTRRAVRGTDAKPEIERPLNVID